MKEPSNRFRSTLLTKTNDHLMGRDLEFYINNPNSINPNINKTLKIRDFLEFEF